MAGRGRWSRWLGLLGLLGLVTTGGCLRCLHPVHPPGNAGSCEACAEIAPEQPWQAVSGVCKRQVYIFFVHGIDPLDCTNLNGVREYVHSLGFIKTYYGTLFHTPHFLQEVRRLQHEQPNTRFVLVGYGHGAARVQEMARTLEHEGTPIDLVVYLDGVDLDKSPEAIPANVGKILNLAGEGWLTSPPVLDGALNVTYPKVSGFGAATHPGTLEALGRELAEVAGKVPVVYQEHGPLMEHPLAPRPISPPSRSGQDGWDFLLPEPQIAPFIPTPPAPGEAPRMPAADEAAPGKPGAPEPIPAPRPVPEGEAGPLLRPPVN